MSETIIAIVLLAVAGLWWSWHRMKRTAARDVAAQLGRIRKSVREERLRTGDDIAQIMATADPVVAAAILIMAIITDGRRITREREKMLHEVIAGVSTPDRALAAVVHAKTIATQAIDTGLVIDTLTPLLCRSLNEVEKGNLIAMARRVATATGPVLPTLETRMHRLRQKLGVGAIG